MAEIKPFCGVHYNREITGDISNVICPPYDIISPRMDEQLHNRNAYNFIRIEYNRLQEDDSDTNNRYTRSAALFQQWLEQKVMVTDDEPAIYVHDQFFHLEGDQYKRRSLIVRVRLEEWSKNIVRPHEKTFRGPKKDRINLLWALNANTSSVMSMYEDKDLKITSFLKKMDTGKLLISTDEIDGERHNVWTITDPEAVKEFCDYFNNKPLYIADGHHRYESALVYKKERSTCDVVENPDAPYNFVMMTLMDMDDPNLIIFPTHRLLHDLKPETLIGLEEKLNMYFDIEHLSLDASDVWQKVDSIIEDEANMKLTVIGLKQGAVSILTLKDLSAAVAMMPAERSDVYKKMDVSIVDHVILEKILGIQSDDEKRIAYTHERKEAVSRALNGDCQLAIIMNMVKGQTIKDIADVKDRMPRKSTYFYPKLPSGLIVNHLV
ncbi:MAG: DUF1015 domain-containing protein [Dehalococcoidales bacterium]|jgi:uncharacterized protein (DUF1015 family)|nr:DUF1015 domain-containing protein [Dehalococcoidales bacterium]MDD3994464.1 DUF1015 domain-containing protein [Dehalococcoidales bacterium]